MNPSEKAIRERGGFDPRFEMMMRRTPNQPRAQKPSKEQQPCCPADAGSLTLRDFYGEAPGFEKITSAELIGDYGKAGYRLVRASLKHIPLIGNVLNGVDAVKDAFKLTGSVFTDGLFSQGTFKAAVEVAAHAVGTIPFCESIGAFYDQSKAIGDFFDAGANTVNYFRETPKMRTPPALQALSGMFGWFFLGPAVNAAGLAAANAGATTAGVIGAATSKVATLTSLHTFLGSMFQAVKSAYQESRQLPRAAPLSA